jgi:hypothetical protein
LATSPSVASREDAAVCRRDGLRDVDPANPLAVADRSSWLENDDRDAGNPRQFKTFRCQLADAGTYVTSALRVP